MTSKREKLQYAYVFLTDFVTTGISVVLAWLITDNVFNKLQDYATFDWIQALCLLLLAFVLTFLCFDQDQNIVTRSKGDEIILALKFNVVLGVVNAACLVLAKATLLDSRYFAVMVPIVNVVLMPITHGLLKKFLLKKRPTPKKVRFPMMRKRFLYPKRFWNTAMRMPLLTQNPSYTKMPP